MSENIKVRDYEYFFNRAQNKFELADYRRGNTRLKQRIRTFTK